MREIEKYLETGGRVERLPYVPPKVAPQVTRPRPTCVNCGQARGIGCVRRGCLEVLWRT